MDTFINQEVFNSTSLTEEAHNSEYQTKTKINENESQLFNIEQIGNLIESKGELKGFEDIQTISSSS